MFKNLYSSQIFYFFIFYYLGGGGIRIEPHHLNKGELAKYLCFDITYFYILFIV